jgi:hypothetical protein
MLTASLVKAQMPNPPAGPEERLLRIVPNAIELKRVESHWQIYSSRQFLRDFGDSERNASEAVRIIRELNLTHYGTIPGAQPTFEFWLSDGQAPRAAFATRTYVPFNNSKLKVEQVLGAWCLRDHQQVLYNFGTDLENAKRALAICQKYHFNELGIVGNPPVMTYLLADDQQRMGLGQQQTPSTLALAAAVAEQGLLLPKLGYVGARKRISVSKLEANRVQNEWCLTLGNEILARFGPNQTDALVAYRQLQDTRASELAYVGTSRIPLYLVNGQLPTGSPLGVNRIYFRAEALTVQAIDESWCILDGTRVLFDFAQKKADAELFWKVLKELGANQIWEVGQPGQGGLRVVSKTR